MGGLINQIFRFYVSVDNFMLMAINHCGKQLFHDFRGLRLFEKLLFNNSLEKLPSLAELGHNIKIFLILEKFVDFENIWVVQSCQNLHLIYKPLLLIFCDFRLGDGFDGPGEPRALVDRLADLAVGALPNDLMGHCVFVGDTAEFLPNQMSLVYD